MQFGRLTILPPAAAPLPLTDPGVLLASRPARTAKPTPAAHGSAEVMGCEMRMSRDHRTLIYFGTTLTGSARALWQENPVVVRVYRDGALIASHRLADIATERDVADSPYVARWARWVGAAHGPAIVVETRRGAFFAVSFSTGALILDETPALT